MTNSSHRNVHRGWVRVLLGMAAVLAITSSGRAASETFVWPPNNEPDIAGYQIYYGTPPGTYTHVTDVGNVTMTTVHNLTPGSLYGFFVTCYNTAGVESDPSEVVEVLIPSDPTQNHTPVALSQTVTAVSGEFTIITLEAHDADGDPVSFNYASFPTHGDVSDYPIAQGNRATITYQSRPGYIGTDEFMFIVNDGWVDSDPATVTIQVTSVNTAPTVDAGTETFATLPSWANLRGKVTDDGLPGTHPEPMLTWSQINGPPGARIQEPNSSSTKVTFAETGSYVFRLEASDGELSGQDDVTIRVGNLSNAIPPLDPFTVHFEAESGTLADPMHVQDDPSASSSRYITTDATGQGNATFVFDLPYNAAVIVWCRVRTPAPEADSFFVTLNNDPTTTDIYDASEGDFSNDWKWTPLYGRGGVDRIDAYAYSLAPRVLDLAAGQHQLTFGGREPGTQLDALIVSTDPTFDPIAAATSSQAPILTHLESLAAQGVTLRWSAIPGRRYQIAYQDVLGTSDWILLPDILLASSSQIEFEHHLSSSAGQRFYRALLLP